MKGAIDIEFLLAAFLFLTTIVFITFSIIGKIPVLQEKSLSENLQSTSYQLSELLLTEGYPENWNTVTDLDQVGYIGLESKSDHILEPSKVLKLNNICSISANYKKLREKMLNYDFIIKITDGTTTLIECNPPVISLTRPK